MKTALNATHARIPFGARVDVKRILDKAAHIFKASENKANETIREASQEDELKVKGSQISHAANRGKSL
jgi:hypothetical protein